MHKMNEAFHMEENIYSDCPNRNCQAADAPERMNNEPVLVQPDARMKDTRISLKKLLLSKSLMGIVAGVAMMLSAVVLVALAICLMKLMYQVKHLELQLDSYQANASTCNNMKLPVHEGNCSSNAPDNKYTVAPVTTCSMLPKSSPSGYYWLLSSNGSTIRVYCDMNKTCGNITGGWMRVASLNMRQPSSKCPSSLCLATSWKHPRTCRRCYSSQMESVASESYHIGISYAHVCGRIKAYQIGTPDGYWNCFTNIFDGISLTYGYPELFIWAFVANKEAKYRHSKSSCPCVNPSDDNIAPPPEFIGNHYFCDTGTVTASAGKFYENNPLWDGSGCKGKNECCSFNNPPWFYRKLLDPTEEPILMKVRLDERPHNEDLAIEIIDIYVQ